ncbi:MAG TPA: hypothetical protein PK821_02510 [Victivallales bacterium]|nr:hypothetical protein [Victivallales bacterium]
MDSHGAKLKAMPPEVIAEMDSAIGILKNAIETSKISIAFNGTRFQKAWTAPKLLVVNC